jgi:HemY protein
VVQAEIYQQQGDWEKSLATLKPLEESRNAMVVRALARVYEELGDYASLYALIATTEKQKVLSSQELDRLRTRILNCWIDQQVDRIQRGRSPEDGLSTLFASLSKSDQSRVEIVQAYAKGLMTLGMSQSAEKVLRPLIKRDVEPSLLALYGRTDGVDVFKQIKLLQSVTCDDRHAMMLALARQSKRAELWGQARDFYQKCFELSPSVEVAKPYAEVLRAMDEPDAAAEVERTAIAAFSR